MADWDLRSIADGFDRAAVDPGAWTGVLNRIGEEVGARGALLLSSDHRVPGSPFSASLAPMLDEYFRDGWSARDPRFRAVPLALRKGVVVDQDFLSADEIASLPYYQDWLRGHGCKFFACVTVPTGSGLITLTIQRSIAQGMFEPHEAKALTTLLKPLSNAVALSRQFGRSYVLGMVDALQFTAHAALLLDEGARVLEVNERCAALLGGGLDVRQGRLAIRDRASRDAVDGLIGRALSAEAGSGDAHGVEIAAGAGRRLRVRAIALREWAKTTFTGASAMLIFEPAPAGPAGPAALAGAYGLTPAEIRLADALRQGLSTAEAAERLGIRYGTVRSHLKSIMHKTDTHRQSQLLALLLKFLP